MPTIPCVGKNLQATLQLAHRQSRWTNVNNIPPTPPKSCRSFSLQLNKRTEPMSEDNKLK